MERPSEKSQSKDEVKDNLTAKVEQGRFKAFSHNDPTKQIKPLKIHPKALNPVQAVQQTVTSMNTTVTKGAKRFWDTALGVLDENKKT